MERQLWSEISQAISDVAKRWKESARFVHATALIARVYLWAVLHDRPVYWACDPRNWDPHTRPPTLPDQSTMSRRLRGKVFEAFTEKLSSALAGKRSASLLKIIDGKPIQVPAHSTDRDATWGRGASDQALGYKLHAIWGDSPMPLAFRITPLGTCEKKMARRLIKELAGAGYLLADNHYDASYLYDAAAAAGHQLVAPRQHPGSGMGHHYQSPQRLRSILLLEPPANVNDFGPRLYERRKDVERSYAHLVTGGMGITVPWWVRRIWRVRQWVHAKLLLNAARIRCRRAAA